MSQATLFSPRVILGWIAAVAAAFALSLYLMAFGGNETRRNTVGPSAYSRSAIGYAGLAELIRRVGIPVVKGGTTAGPNDRPRLLIVAEPPLSSVAEDGKFAFGRANNVLVILPKWQGLRSTSHQGWIGDAEPMPAFVADGTIEKAGATGKTVVADLPERWTINLLGTAPQLGSDVQLIENSNLRPIVSAGERILIGEKVDRNRRIWIVSDPDILANHGLLNAGNAKLAIGIVNALRPRQGDVVFDESVRGFAAPATNPLALMFQFPFVTVTIQMVAAVALLLWATVVRFGAPEAVPVLLDAGKQGLIRNAANLLRHAGHPEMLVTNYVRSTIRAVARQLRAPPGLDPPALIAWIGRVGLSRRVAVDVGDLVRRTEHLAASNTVDTSMLVALARDAHRWKQEILHGP
jgi:hypothetical protein